MPAAGAVVLAVDAGEGAPSVLSRSIGLSVSRTRPPSSATTWFAAASVRQSDAGTVRAMTRTTSRRPGVAPPAGDPCAS